MYTLKLQGDSRTSRYEDEEHSDHAPALGVFSWPPGQRARTDRKEIDTRQGRPIPGTFGYRFSRLDLVSDLG